MTLFNAQKARTKRPCPFWMDAFLLDTQQLLTDEIGAYFLILGSMWTRESCDLPNDLVRLARTARVSSRLWTARIGPALLPFFSVVGGAIIQKRLRKEADYVEAHCKAQSDRRKYSDAESDPFAFPTEKANDFFADAEKSGKPLKNNIGVSTADVTADATADISAAPTYLQPNNLTTKEDLPPPPSLTARGETAAAEGDLDDLYERLLSAAGYSDSGKIPLFWRKGQVLPFLNLWLEKLTPDQIIAVADKRRELMPIPPNGPKALSEGMREAWSVPAKPVSNPDDVPKYFADLINSDRYLAPSAVSTGMRTQLLSLGLVTPERMKARGVK